MADRATGMGLGRLQAPDDRDRLYQLPRRPRAAAGVRRRVWWAPAPMDQGSTSQCVAYSVLHYLRAGPITNPVPPMPPHELYREAQMIDEWPGENYDGTSVRAGFKVLNRIGLVSEYRWAFDLETVINHVLGTSPMVVGTDWHWDMFTPDRNGFIWPTGGNAGGHAYLLLGADRDRVEPTSGKTGAFRVLNSWGDGWAQKGRAWITFEAFEGLLLAAGEAALATEVRRR